MGTLRKILLSFDNVIGGLCAALICNLKYLEKSGNFMQFECQMQIHWVRSIGINLGLSPNLRPYLTSCWQLCLVPDLRPNFGHHLG